MGNIGTHMDITSGGRDIKQNWEGCGINSVDGVSREE